MLRLALLCLVPALSIAEISLPSGFQPQLIYESLNSPTSMAVAPDGRVFICQQGGEVRVIMNDSMLPSPFVTVATRVSDEQGLVGIALDPEFSNNGYLYLDFTSPAPPYRNQVVRFTAQGNVSATGSERTLFVLDKAQIEYHLGGALFFGLDGRLFITTGEGGTKHRVQSLDNLHGKILRINKDGSIPEDNPFFQVAQSANRAIWALGFRAPFTAAIQSGTGRIYVMDVGGNHFEEVDEVNRGGNYGWPYTEGLGPPSLPQLPPTLTYSHGPNPGQGNSVCGGAFYPVSGGSFPYPYPGKFFFADYTLGWIRVLNPGHTNGQGDTAAYFAEHLTAPVDLDLAPDGSLYCLQRGKVTMDGGSGPGWSVGSLLRISYGRPALTAQPASYEGSVGEQARFHVGANGKNPIEYQWQKKNRGTSRFQDIPGSTQPDLLLADLGMREDGSHYRCRVRNAVGESFSQAALLSVSRNQRPQAIIETPSPVYQYTAGTALQFRGRGEDPEEGALSPKAYTWWVDFHHDDHVHPFLAPISGMREGSFLIPDTGETSDNVFYRINLKVTDGSGLSQTSWVDVMPRKTPITLTSNPPGLILSVDGKKIVTPQTVLSVVGMKRNIRAISPQRYNGGWMVFKTWSDDGLQSHDLVTPPQEEKVHTRFTSMPIFEKAIKILGKGMAKMRRKLGTDPESA